MSLLIDLADAITEDLKAQDFGVVLDWERSYLEQDLELKSAGVLRGDVSPLFNTAVELETRESLHYELTIELFIRKRFTTDDVDEAGRLYKDQIDELVGVLEAVHEHFAKGSPIANTAYSPSREVDVRAWFVREHLRQWSQFTGIVRLPYYATKDL